MNQVECLLNIICACRQINFDEYLAALDQQCKYFFAHDLYHYARLIPVLLIPKDKNSFMHAIDEAVFPEQLPIPKEETEVVPLEIKYVGNESLCQSELSDTNLEEELQVIIFDGMAVLQSMKKNLTMKKIFDLADQFVKRVR